MATNDPLKKLPAAFYATVGGNEPVKDWLRALTLADRKIVSQDIAKVEYGWPVGMPVCRSLGNGLWEVRSTFEDGRIARVLWIAVCGRLVLLLGFHYSTQRLPQSE